MLTKAQANELYWLPIEIDSLLSSPAWTDMRDFQRGWYFQLLLRSVRSELPGFLRLDSNLWTIAGAKRSDFWESHKACVLACFKVREMEGQSWIYNERLLHTLEVQYSRRKRRKTEGGTPLPFNSLSDFSEKERKEPPGNGETPDLPAMQLARMLMEQVGLSCALANLMAAADTITACSKATGWSIPRSFEQVRTTVKEGAANGERIDKFWFTDLRWNAAGVEVNGAKQGGRKNEKPPHDCKPIGPTEAELETANRYGVPSPWTCSCGKKWRFWSGKWVPEAVALKEHEKARAVGMKP